MVNIFTKIDLNGLLKNTKWIFIQNGPCLIACAFALKLQTLKLWQMSKGTKGLELVFPRSFLPSMQHIEILKTMSWFESTQLIKYSIKVELIAQHIWDIVSTTFKSLHICHSKNAVMIWAILKNGFGILQTESTFTYLK